MRRGVLLMGAIAFGTVVAATPAAAALFAFDNYLNKLTDLSITSGGLTATFSSSSGPGTFAVAQPVGLYSFPVALGDYGNFQGDPLTITFSDPVMDRLLIPFGIEEAFATVPATLVVRANTGQTVTFTTAFNNLISGAPEGVATFTPTSPISSVMLMSSIAYAIASVDLPEPMSVVLLGAGLVGLAGLRRRRRA